jgi:hypothetical protein
LTKQLQISITAATVCLAAFLTVIVKLELDFLGDFVSDRTFEVVENMETKHMKALVRESA